MESYLCRESLLFAYLNEMNMQAAEPGHGQGSGKVTQALAVFQMPQANSAKKQLGSQFKAVMTPQVITVSIFPEVLSSFV